LLAAAGIVGCQDTNSTDEAEPTQPYTPPSWRLSTAANQFFGGVNINAVAYGSGRFVAVYDGGGIAYSSDGDTWNRGRIFSSTGTECNPVITIGSPVGGNFKAIAYGNGRFVAGCRLGNGYYSTDGGTLWTSAGSIFSGGEEVNGIAYDITASRFVAVGNNGKISYSTNGGAPWIPVTSIPSSVNTTNINAIAFGYIENSSSNRLVAVGDNGIAIHSRNGGTTWEGFETRFTDTQNITSVNYSNRQWTMGGVGGTLLISNDADITNPMASDFRYIEIGTILSIGYGNGKWIITGSNSRLAKATSLRGSWEIASIREREYILRSIAYNPNTLRWVAVGAPTSNGESTVLIYQE
jgi:hypothetical protein